MIDLVEERFWDKVDKHSDDLCWEWTGVKDRKGYGQIKIEGKTKLAHRISYEIVNGTIPEGIDYHGVCVCHKCDNRLCVNPGHLFLGSQKDNLRDMIKKGRRVNTAGSHNGNVKLTESQVLLIREDRRSGVVIASDYGVSRSQISNIKNRHQWKHL